MANRLRFVGLDQLVKDLQALPGHLRDEAKTLIQASATEAKAEMQAAYPEGPKGRLKRGLSVTVRDDAFGAAGIVKNSSPHAFIFESGTEARYVHTLPLSRAKNFGYRRGAMPPGRVFIPIAMRHRREMYQGLSDVVRRAGFQVSGHAG